MKGLIIVLCLISVAVSFAYEDKWQDKVDESFVVAYEKQYENTNIFVEFKKLIENKNEKKSHVNAILRITPVSPDSIKQYIKKGYFSTEPEQFVSYNHKFENGNMLEYHMPIQVKLSSLPDLASRKCVLSIYKERDYPIEIYEGFFKQYKIA